MIRELRDLGQSVVAIACLRSRSMATFWSWMRPGHVAYGFRRILRLSVEVLLPSFTTGEYEGARLAVGTPVPPLPPFIAGAPPVNVLYLLACNCGDTPDFKKSLWPYYMGWGGPHLENQAVLAYSVLTVLTEFSIHASIVGYALCGGRTVFKTHQYFEKWLRDNPDVLHSWDDYYHENPTAPRRMKAGDFVAIYDPSEGGCARVVSVYTGTNVNPIGWFQQL